MKSENILRSLPKIDLLAASIESSYGEKISYHLIVESCRRVIEKLRSDILVGLLTDVPDISEIKRLVYLSLEEENAYSLREVINASGVVIHTNLGRSVLAKKAVENVVRIASSYSTLEYDLDSGERGSRHSHTERLLKRITGAEAAMVVNNNAAAILLCLSELGYNKSVVVSRGELVEIGGSFRIPDIMRLSGAILREIGTTNKTKIEDYKNAIDENTACLLKVHTSNFKIVGFTESPSLVELAALAKDNGIPLVYDLGSGLLDDGETVTASETSVVSSIKEGASVVCFSGDKLFGGPQAGIIIGKREYIERMKKNQLARVVRIDKLTLAALEATLKLYIDKELAKTEIPTLRFLTMPVAEIEQRAKRLKRRLPNTDDFTVTVKKSLSQAGGGSCPGENLDSYVLEIVSRSKSAAFIEREFREYETPIITRINKGAVLIDIRTVFDAEFDTIVSAYKKIAERNKK